MSEFDYEDDYTYSVRNMRGILNGLLFSGIFWVTVIWGGITFFNAIS